MRKPYYPQIRVGVQGETPHKVFLNGEWLRVADIIDRWKDVGEWWRGETEKYFWRLQLELGQIVEIYQELNKMGTWRFYKMWD